MPSVQRWPSMQRPVSSAQRCRLLLPLWQVVPVHMHAPAYDLSTDVLDAAFARSLCVLVARLRNVQHRSAFALLCSENSARADRCRHTAASSSRDRRRKRGRQPKALLLTNPHNPLGTCMSVGALRRTLAWARSKDLHLISDEVAPAELLRRAVPRTRTQ